MKKLLIKFNTIMKKVVSRKRVCSVTGIMTSPENFYRNQTHVKAVDNLRRNTGATKEQLTRMFNQLTTY
jgi:hypothetical protein